MEIYEFNISGTDYYFTSSNTDITIGSKIYKAIPITRSEISYELKANTAKVKTSLRDAPFNTLVTQSLKDLASVKIYRYPEDILIFYGKITKVQADYAKQEIELYLGNIYDLENTKIPKRTYSPTCPWTFCSKECGLNITDYQFTLLAADITIIDNKHLQADKFRTINYNLTAGYIRTSNDEYHFIINHSSNEIELLLPITNLQFNNILFTGGCDKTKETCKNIYNNLNNFGGFPFIPSNNIATSHF